VIELDARAVLTRNKVFPATAAGRRAAARTKTSPETSALTTFRAPAMTATADSNTKDQTIDRGSNPRATDYRWPILDRENPLSFLVHQTVSPPDASVCDGTIPVISQALAVNKR
jgi:hypothetical protein